VSNRATILTAAVSALSDKGIDAVTITCVAARAGFSRFTVHKYFGTAAELQNAAAQEARRRGDARACAWLDMAGWG
jgi:AcrR family transcriptional regulator